MIHRGWQKNTNDDASYFDKEKEQSVFYLSASK
jgi:predicted Zn-dependent protease